MGTPSRKKRGRTPPVSSLKLKKKSSSSSSSPLVTRSESTATATTSATSPQSSGTAKKYPNARPKPQFPTQGGAITYSTPSNYEYADKRNIHIRDVGRGYFMYTELAFIGLLLIIGVAALIQAYHTLGTSDIETIYHNFIEPNRLRAIALTMLVFGLILAYWLKRAPPVYLVNFSVLKPPEELKIPSEFFRTRSIDVGAFDDSALQFQHKLLDRTGLGEETYFPPGIHKFPPELTMEQAREEARIAMFMSLDDLFAKTGTRPQDIDILIVNCSLFCPTPSLASMVVNRFKMKSSILSYNLGGMGCSASLISIDLAKRLLQVHSNSLAVVISTENITQNWYLGCEKSMLVTNTLFRLGGAAMLLSNRPRDRSRSISQLMHTVRVHKGQNDQAYRAIFQREDVNGTVGVSLSKYLVTHVGSAIKENFSTLGPLILPLSEQLKFFWSFSQKHYLKMKDVKQYIPDFHTAIDYYCIHAGGRAIIDGVQQNLHLTKDDVEASRWALWRYGNTSSASIWYEYMFLTKYRRLVRGQKILQLALGSGLKVNTAVWKVLPAGETKPTESPPNVDYVTS